MAAVAKTVVPSLATKTPCHAHISVPLVAGEALAAGDACYIHTDGRAYRSTGAAAAPAARVDGWATIAYPVGMPCTLYHDVLLAYGPATLAPGTRLFVSDTTPGGLVTTATTGGTGPVAVVEKAVVDQSTPHAIIRALRSAY
jgi:hypothetical protein